MNAKHLYYLAPQVSGAERYNRLAAYGNWGCHTAGVILMAFGFHLIGVFGLASGYNAGSPEFRAIAAPFKTLVSMGGILITVSAVLFIVNIGRTLLAGLETRSALAMVLAGVLVPATAPAGKGHHARRPAGGCGPRPGGGAGGHVGALFDMAHVHVFAIGGSGAGLSQLPVQARSRAAAGIFARQHEIKRILIEKSDPFCTYVPDLKLEKIVAHLDGKGFEIETTACPAISMPVWWSTPESCGAGPVTRKRHQVVVFFLTSPGCFYSRLSKVQALVTELNREPRENRGRARRCNRGRGPHHATDSGSGRRGLQDDPRVRRPAWKCVTAASGKAWRPQGICG